jgi:hypothetical protein
MSVMRSIVQRILIHLVGSACTSCSPFSLDGDAWLLPRHSVDRLQAAERANPNAKGASAYFEVPGLCNSPECVEEKCPEVRIHGVRGLDFSKVDLPLETAF